MNFCKLASTRQSVRSFKSEKPSKEILEQVMEAVRIAPSAVNYQPWKFIVVCNDDLLSKLHECYPREWFSSAPTCIVALGNHQEAWHRQADGKDHTDIDVSIAIDHLILQAAELGLGTCWVCNFDSPKVSKLFQLPDYLEPIALIPIGYPTDELIAKDKKRKSQDEIVSWM